MEGDNIGLSATQIGAALSFGFFLDTSLFLPVGWAMDVYGRKTMGMPAMLILSLGLLVLPSAHTFTGLCIASILCGIGNGLSNGLNITLGMY
jgi:MFS family permease